jgi:hypothetical protein
MAASVAMATVKFETVQVQSEVESVEVEDHDRMIDRARIVFDAAGDVAAIVREQSKVLITLGWTDENAVLFEGLIASVKPEARGAGKPRVTVIAYDLSYKMKQNRTKDRSFISGKLSDALNAIAADYAPDIAVGSILPNPDPVFTPASPWSKITGASDWDFVQEAALKWKARVFVEYNNNQSQFYFVAEQSLLSGTTLGTLHYCPGGVGPLLTFDYQRIGAGAAPLSAVTVIDPATGQPAPQPAPDPPDDPPLQVGPNASSAATQAAGIFAQAAGQPADSRPRDSLAGQPSDVTRAQQNIVQDPTRALGFSGKGLCRGTIMLRAKGTVAISGLPPWVTATWYVKQVNHVYTRLAGVDKAGKPANRSTFETKFQVTR